MLAGLAFNEYDKRPTAESLPLSADDARLLLDLQQQLGSVTARAHQALLGPAPTAVAQADEGGGGENGVGTTAGGQLLSLLEGLDDVLLVHAFVFLSATDIAKARRVSRRFLRVASGRAVWRPLCLRDWPWLDQLASEAATEAGAGTPFAPSPSPSASSPSSDPTTALYRLYRQRTLAHRLVRPPPPSSCAARKPLSDLELCVDLWIDGEVWWSARGPLPSDEEAFREALFSFHGFELEPTFEMGPPDGRPIFFKEIGEVVHWFNGSIGYHQLHFTLLDTKTGRMADLSSVLRRTALMAAVQGQDDHEGGAAAANVPLDGTRASIGWDSTGQGNVQEVWVFSNPDHVFLQGEIRLLRGLTLQVFDVRFECEGRVTTGIGVDVVAAWMCDHQYLGGPKPSMEDVRTMIFEELKWV